MAENGTQKLKSKLQQNWFFNKIAYVGDPCYRERPCASGNTSVAQSTTLLYIWSQSCRYGLVFNLRCQPISKDRSRNYRKGDVISLSKTQHKLKTVIIMKDKRTSTVCRKRNPALSSFPLCTGMVAHCAGGSWETAFKISPTPINPSNHLSLLFFFRKVCHGLIHIMGWRYGGLMEAPLGNCFIFGSF